MARASGAVLSGNSGVACDCATCGSPQWYEHGVCCGCQSSAGFTHTWIARCETGGVPEAAPDPVLRLEVAAGDRLIDVWTDLVLLRGLSPYLVPSPHSVARYSSPAWYAERGIQATVHCGLPADPGFAERLNRASSWANQSLIVRMMTTFEAFFDRGEHLRHFRLPNASGMREFHHARRLRNSVAHGDTLTDSRLLDEARYLFGSEAVVAGACNLDIKVVLEPLWARLLIYARCLEESPDVPDCPAVVVAARDHDFILQGLAGADGELRARRDSVDWKVGDLVSAADIPKRARTQSGSELTRPDRGSLALQ